MNLERRFVGCDLDDEVVALATKRVSEARSSKHRQESLHSYWKGTHSGESTNTTTSVVEESAEHSTAPRSEEAVREVFEVEDDTPTGTVE